MTYQGIRLALIVLCLGAVVLAQGCAAVASRLEDIKATVFDKASEITTEASGIATEALEEYGRAGAEVTEEEEIEIGGNLISGLLGAAPLVEDAKLQRYVNDVGFWVATQSERRDLPWRFGVIQSEGINAFAAPGGYVVITMGLFKLFENEAQLAGVLGHEIAHVVRKHHLKVLQKTMKQEFWTNMTTRVLGDSEARRKLRAWVSSGMQLYTTGLGRDYEHEADLLGVVLAGRAGYDAYALLDVLTTIDALGSDGSHLIVLLNTHPPTVDRLEHLATRMDSRSSSFSSGQSNARRFTETTSHLKSSPGTDVAH